MRVDLPRDLPKVWNGMSSHQIHRAAEQHQHEAREHSVRECEFYIVWVGGTEYVVQRSAYIRAVADAGFSKDCRARRCRDDAPSDQPEEHAPERPDRSRAARRNSARGSGIQGGRRC